MAVLPSAETLAVAPDIHTGVFSVPELVHLSRIQDGALRIEEYGVAVAAMYIDEAQMSAAALMPLDGTRPREAAEHSADFLSNRTSERIAARNLERRITALQLDVDPAQLTHNELMTREASAPYVGVWQEAHTRAMRRGVEGVVANLLPRLTDEQIAWEMAGAGLTQILPQIASMAPEAFDDFTQTALTAARRAFGATREPLTPQELADRANLPLLIRSQAISGLVRIGVVARNVELNLLIPTGRLDTEPGLHKLARGLKEAFIYTFGAGMVRDMYAAMRGET